MLWIAALDLGELVGQILLVVVQKTLGLHKRDKHQPVEHDRHKPAPLGAGAQRQPLHKRLERITLREKLPEEALCHIFGIERPRDLGRHRRDRRLAAGIELREVERDPGQPLDQRFAAAFARLVFADGVLARAHRTLATLDPLQHGCAARRIFEDQQMLVAQLLDAHLDHAARGSIGQRARAGTAVHQHATLLGDRHQRKRGICHRQIERLRARTVPVELIDKQRLPVEGKDRRADGIELQRHRDLVC